MLDLLFEPLQRLQFFQRSLLDGGIVLALQLDLHSVPSRHHQLVLQVFLVILAIADGHQLCNGLQDGDPFLNLDQRVLVPVDEVVKLLHGKVVNDVAVEHLVFHLAHVLILQMLLLYLDCLCEVVELSQEVFFLLEELLHEFEFNHFVQQHLPKLFGDHLGEVLLNELQPLLLQMVGVSQKLNHQFLGPSDDSTFLIASDEIAHAYQRELRLEQEALLQVPWSVVDLDEHFLVEVLYLFNQELLFEFPLLHFNDLLDVEALLAKDARNGDVHDQVPHFAHLLDHPDIVHNGVVALHLVIVPASDHV